MNQATTRPLSDKTGQRLFCAQQHEPRPRLFRPVCKTKPMAWSERNPRVRSTRLFLRKSTEFLWPVRACETGFSPGWETDPLQAPKARIRPCVGKVEKSPNIASKEGVKKKQVKGCGSVNRPTPGSQWPAEPATSGFFGSSTPHKKCGSVNGPLGQAVGHRIRKSRISGKNPWVRLWVWPQNPDGRNV